MNDDIGANSMGAGGRVGTGGNGASWKDPGSTAKFSNLGKRMTWFMISAGIVQWKGGKGNFAMPNPEGENEKTYEFPGTISGSGQGDQITFCVFTCMEKIEAGLGGTRTRDDFMDIYAKLEYNDEDGNKHIVGKDRAKKGANRGVLFSLLNASGFNVRTFDNSDEDKKLGINDIEIIGSAMASGKYVLTMEDLGYKEAHGVLLTRISIANDEVTGVQVWNPGGLDRFTNERGVGQLEKRDKNYFVDNHYKIYVIYGLRKK